MNRQYRMTSHSLCDYKSCIDVTQSRQTPRVFDVRIPNKPRIQQFASSYMITETENRQAGLLIGKILCTQAVKSSLASLPLLLQFRQLFTKSHCSIHIFLLERLPLEQRLDKTVKVWVFLARRVSSSDLQGCKISTLETAEVSIRHQLT
jgi:hypothetical protein